MKQHIDFPTHTCGNILDQIINRTNNTIASDFEQSILFSDHYAIYYVFNTFIKLSQAKKNISYRKLSFKIIINSLPHCFTTPHSLYDNTCLFETFIPPTTDLIIKLIKSNKSTSLNDPLPISILHQLARLIAPHLTSIICRSLLTALFPDSMTNSIITPQIKKIKSDPNDLKNYRSISQLTIFSKIVERCFSHQIVSYLKIKIFYIHIKVHTHHAKALKPHFAK